MDYLQYFWNFKSSKIINCVLNLIINGLPSILGSEIPMQVWKNLVLNLIINGLPSIHGIFFFAYIL